MPPKVRTPAPSSPFTFHQPLPSSQRKRADEAPSLPTRASARLAGEPAPKPAVVEPAKKTRKVSETKKEKVEVMEEEVVEQEKEEVKMNGVAKKGGKKG